MNTHFTSELNRWRKDFFRAIALVIILLLLAVVVSRRISEAPKLTTDAVLIGLAGSLFWLFLKVKHGYKFYAGVILVSFSWLTISFTTWASGGIFDSSAVAFLALILISFLLLNSRFTLVLTLFTLAWLWMLSFMHEADIKQFSELDRAYVYAREITVAMVIITAIGHFYIANINKYIVRISEELRERGKVEKELRASEAKYRSLFDQSVEGILIGNREGKILLANDAMSELSGYSIAELEGKNIRILFDENELEREPLRFDLLEPGKVVLRTRNIITRSGQVRTIEMRTKCLEDGRLQSLIFDITESIKARKSLADYERIFRLSANPICITSVDGTLTRINPAFAHILGYRVDEVEGRNIMEFMHPDDHKKTSEYIAGEMQKRSEILTVENRYVSKDGKVIWFAWTTQPVYEEGIGFSVAHDISAIKRFERELIAAKEKAEESDRLKSSFLANMSHEIRTPMNSIIGFSEMFMSSELNDEERIHFGRIVYKSGVKLMRVLDDILDISRIETGRIEFNYEAVNLERLMDDIYDFHYNTAKERKLEFSLEKPDPGKEYITVIDKVRLQQVIDNLISNAFKFTHEGSVSFGFAERGDFLQFFVKDTGVGISKNAKDLIFERFRQEDSSVAKEYGGTGLGLAISQKLVQLMGGEIWVESEKNEGSNFLFTIPFRRGDLPGDKGTQHWEKGKGASHEEHLVLVAEDEYTNLEFLNALLRRKGVISIHAANGMEAVRLVQENPAIELVLMDIKMPVMNGLEATRAIKKIRPTLPVVAQTAFAMQNDRKQALDAGCDDFLSKPIQKDSLFSVLDHFLVH